MAGLELQIRLDDFKARTMLDALAGFDKNQARGMFDEIGGHMVSEIGRRFKQSIDAEGGQLIPSRRAREESGKTLVDRGHLRDSYTYQVFINGRGVEIGSNMIYAAIHHFGGEAGRDHAVTLPARPVLGINADDEQEIDAIIFDHISKVLRG